jgi:hypothetical protein
VAKLPPAGAGCLIGTTRRELQLVVSTDPPRRRRCTAGRNHAAQLHNEVVAEYSDYSHPGHQRHPLVMMTVSQHFLGEFRPSMPPSAAARATVRAGNLTWSWLHGQARAPVSGAFNVPV